MFDVHFFQSLLGKNNLALIGKRSRVPAETENSRFTGNLNM